MTSFAKNSNKSDDHLVSYILISIFIFLLIIYFSYHMFAGQAGLMSLINYKSELAEVEQEDKKIKNRLASLENKVKLMNRKKPDHDLLEEMVRHNFSNVKKNEILIITE